jgi:low temperature requirement protein LtrA
LTNPCQFGRNLFLLVPLRRQKRQHFPERAIIWHAVAGVPWLTGALVPGTARTGLWAVAIVLLYVARWFNYPLPNSRMAGADLPPGGEYMAERHQALFVIGLGEAVLTIGTTLTNRGFDTARTVAFVVAFLLTALIWQIYIFHAGDEIAPAIEASAKPGQLSNLLSYAYLIMIGGPALFLVGRPLVQYLVFSRIWGGSLIGPAVLDCLLPPVLFAPPLVTAMVTGAAADTRCAARSGGQAAPRTSADSPSLWWPAWSPTRAGPPNLI